MKKMQLDVGNEPYLWQQKSTANVTNVVKFQGPICKTFQRYELLSSLIFGPVHTDGRTDRQTESDTYEPTVQNAEVGSKCTGGLKNQ